jgi:16S rRNA (uracil1498-N3)-methyltransferase
MFYLPPEAWQEPYLLAGTEAHHALRVLRLRVGDEIRLLDGQGREGAFRIAGHGKHGVELEALGVRLHPRPASRPILAAGWTRAARRGWFLEKAVEFEAAAIWLWQAERSQFSVPPGIRESWQGQLVAGAKQCRNPWLPELRVLPGGVRDVIEAASGCAGFDRRFALLESDHCPAAALTPDRLGLPGCTVYVVGPEGGFTPAEAHALLDAGFAGVTLGRRVLRWETAAMLCLGLHWWKQEQWGSEVNG